MSYDNAVTAYQIVRDAALKHAKCLEDPPSVQKIWSTPQELAKWRLEARNIREAVHVFENDYVG